MFDFLKSARWSVPRVGSNRREPWSLDRNWHRSEAERQLKARNYAEAARHFARAAADADLRGASSKQRVRLYLMLSEAQRQVAIEAPGMSRELLAKAEASVRQAIAIAAAASDKEEYVKCLDALGDVFAKREDYASLEKIAQEGIRLSTELHRPDTLLMAKRVHRLAVARYKNGNNEEAIPTLERSLRLHEESLGAETPEMAAMLFEVGCIYRAQGEYKRAQECLHKALQLHERHAGPDSPEAAADVQQLAGAYEDAGNLDKAAEQYERCLTLKQRKIGVKHIEEVAVMQFSLANLHAGWGNLARARELLTDCIGAFRRDGGPRLAVTHEMLAQIEERSGSFHGAIKELESAGKVWEKCGRVPELIGNLNYRADLLDQLRRNKEAGWLRERAAALKTGTSEQTPMRAQIA